MTDKDTLFLCRRKQEEETLSDEETVHKVKKSDRM